MTKLRIVHTQNHNFRPDFSGMDLEQSYLVRNDLNYNIRGEWLGYERYTIQIYRGYRKGWVNAGDDHWYKQDTFGTYAEAMEAVKYFDGTIKEKTVVWESR